jgi:hypothetical protein
VKQEERTRLEERKQLLAKAKAAHKEAKKKEGEERRRRQQIREENLLKGSSYQVVCILKAWVDDASDYKHRESEENEQEAKKECNADARFEEVTN